MGDDPWKQVNVRVRESTKERWEEYAQTEYGGMSDLVRTAVRREIAGDHDRENTGTTTDPGMVTEVAESIDGLENTVREMDRRLEAIRESVQSEEKYSFKAAIRESLNKRPKDANVEETPQYGLTASEIAARLDANETDVREALLELENSGEVRSLGGGPDNANYYFQRRGE
ncbi:hypothetical protein [Halolamina salifodinae]|uniref:Vacuolar-type H+-ATPase subunit I/STV1 n=1 Tax=Halolamina salifodinae TaxID=1202767 RepID=A0A8T4GTY3_9EURY|nr:hypothetical protein [Halolamina salifodinae]MBP1985850.1 vacuolar-type H+-ATPase subunit I/STV1 [Halolamina salifodinae]